MGEVVERSRLLASARAELLDRPDAPLRGIPGQVAASWRRSVARGVDPSVVVNRYHPDLERDSRLVRYARPVMEQLAAQISEIPVCIVLTDEHARVLVRLDSTPRIGRAADDNSLAEGFGYGECAVGTNGVGTVLEVGGSVHIVGAEHFVERLQPYACAGAPVRDPFTGRIAGVIDISCWAEHSSPVMHSLARSAAARISDGLLRDRDTGQQALFDAYTRLEARTRHAVLAVGQRMVMTNTAMQTLLDPGDLAVLQDHARFVMLGGPAVDEPVDLPSGTRVRLRGTTVPAGGDVAGLVGVVGVLREAGSTGGAVPARRCPEPVTTSPAVRAAWERGCDALRSRTPLLVVGEPGAGRRWLLGELDTALHGPGHVVEIGPGDLEALAGTGPSDLVVLRDLDRIDDDGARLLLTVLDGCTARLAATASDAARRGPAHDALLGRFGQSVTVPPLRHRVGDLPALASALLVPLAPGRRVALSAQALRTLSRYGWPGNVRELRDALDIALRRRPVGEIQAADLPESCQSAPRDTLRPVERAERDAIVGALREADGKRVAAATALGVSRSTLYRKIAQFGITD